MAALAITASITLGCNTYCPQGYYRLDDTCYKVKDAGTPTDAGEPAMVGDDGPLPMADGSAHYDGAVDAGAPADDDGAPDADKADAGPPVGQQPDTCSSLSCRNGGTCSSSKDRCICPPGFSGAMCEDDVCDPNPCQHLGSCSRTPTGAICNCSGTGFSGSRCEVELDECEQPNMCSFPDYPCVETIPSGYACQGHYAEWAMPDALQGAKIAPAYDTTTAPGVVFDNVTGLTWQRALPGTSGAPSNTYAGCTGGACQRA